MRLAEFAILITTVLWVAKKSEEVLRVLKKQKLKLNALSLRLVVLGAAVWKM
jgi:hypothetical protein